VGGTSVSLLKHAGVDIVELVFLFAGTLSVLALDYVQVDYSNHSHPLGLVFVDSLREISHVVHLDQRVCVQLKLVNVRLHQILDSLLSETLD